MKAIRALVAGLAIASSAALVSANVNPNTNDALTLDFALQLEYLEAQFYQDGLAQLSNANFTAAGVPTSVRDYIVLIAAHEQAHVNALKNVFIPAYGATPSSPCSKYSFTDGGVGTVQQFLATAVTLEDVGVSAYAGAINALSLASTVEAAATIATIEARHASFIRSNAGVAASGTKVPFPDTTDKPRTPSEVVAAASSFFVTCTYSFSDASKLPTVRPAGVTFNASSITTPIKFSATSTTPIANPSYSQDQFNADIGVLNYALTLEYLEADFYKNNSAKFTAQMYDTFSSGNGASIFNNVALIAEHEAAHVTAIQGQITSRGQSYVSNGCYDWSSIKTVQQFLQVARILENTGVSAYDGAAKTLTDTSLLQIAATIATVEARHAAYLNQLNGIGATSNGTADIAFDVALGKDAIISAAGSALGSMLVALNAPSTGCPAQTSGGTGTTGSNPSGSSTGTNGNNNIVILDIVFPGDFNSYNASGLAKLSAQIASEVVSAAGGGRATVNSIAAGSIKAQVLLAGAPDNALANIQANKGNFPLLKTATVSQAAAGNAASSIGAGIATLALAAVAALLF